MGGLKEECGIFGFFNNDDYNAAEMIYYGLFALQHRGQDSCGIAINDQGRIIYTKETGLVNEVFDEITLAHLQGKMGIGHVRYSTTGENLRENAQPLVLKYTNGHMAVAHNGNIVNDASLRADFQRMGFIFQSDTDSEVIAALFSRERMKSPSLEKAIENSMRILKGAYSIMTLTRKKLIAARDPLGIRPLVIGKLNNSHVVCSETAALNAIGAEFIRDVRPGEIIVITEDGLKSIQVVSKEKSALCIFEHVYFARLDSVIDGSDVYESRLRAGQRLAEEYDIDADAVIGVPDSGIPSALGFAERSGLPYIDGLIKNRYVGRTFIQPTQSMREQSVNIKLSAIKCRVQGKRLIMIDDSIVRGTTSRKIVQMLKNAGAKEVHLLVSSPPVKFPCFFGIDIALKEHLAANNLTQEDMRKSMGADSLGYLSVEGLLDTPRGAKSGFCKACFDGRYPIDVSERLDGV
ncbi:MAG: amidophosphoribosyltransferase [Clostridiales bacterium]|jgi:amidophosphoribosyltransferase|nr:amidophosphoribosyltransferase [Clostridiales bacterium]